MRRSSGDTDTLTVKVKVKNTGRDRRAGRCHNFTSMNNAPTVVRPEKELKAFAKVALQSGEEEVVSFDLKKRDFAYYDVSIHDWTVNPGKFDILVGGSSRDLPLEQTIEVTASPDRVFQQLTRDSLLKEFADHPTGKAFYNELVEAFGLGKSRRTTRGGFQSDAPKKPLTKRKADMAVKAFLDDMPVYKVCAFSEGRFAEERLEAILASI